MWRHHYLKPSMQSWPQRPDLLPQQTVAQQIQLINLAQASLPDVSTLSFALLGFKSDEGVRRNYGNPGASTGPDAIRYALAGLAWLRPHVQCYDVGDIVCFDKDLEAAQLALSEVVALLLKQKLIPILCGGGHEIAWGHYQGLVKGGYEKQLAILNFDAHFDMRPTHQHLSTSGTSFLQIAEYLKTTFPYYCLGIQRYSNTSALQETAKQYQVQYILAETFYEQGLAPATTLIKKILTQYPYLYTSICLDVFASAYAPGVSAPQPLGLHPWQILPLLRLLAQSGQVCSYDIAELAPNRDINHVTAKLAAHLIVEIIHWHGHSL